MNEYGLMDVRLRSGLNPFQVRICRVEGPLETHFLVAFGCDDPNIGLLHESLLLRLNSRQRFSDVPYSPFLWIDHFSHAIDALQARRIVHLFA